MQALAGAIMCKAYAPVLTGGLTPRVSPFRRAACRICREVVLEHGEGGTRQPMQVVFL